MAQNYIRKLLGLHTKKGVIVPNWCVVGTGNRGERYRDTRHNMGWEVLDRFTANHRRSGGAPRDFRGAELKYVHCADSVVAIAKPLNYVNNSGGVVLKLLHYFKLEIAKLVVVTDDINLHPGVLRVRTGGSDGGHNGLKSITNALGRSDFIRLRVGVGSPPARSSQVNYVLGRPSRAQRSRLDPAVVRAAKAVETVVTAGVEAAMNDFNSST